MKMHLSPVLLLLAAWSLPLQADLPCREDGYGNYICDERSEDTFFYSQDEEVEDVYRGIPTGIPGIVTPRPTLRQAQPRDEAASPAPTFGAGAAADDEDGEVVDDIAEDGLGNYRATTSDGRVIFGSPDPYGDTSWRDVNGLRVECAFDDEGRLICP